MPHIIVEYSKNLEELFDLPDMLIDMHEALAGKGIEKTRIKTRGISIDHAIVGDTGHEGAMMHCTLLLLEGRDIETKKDYGDALHHVMSHKVANIIDHCAVTLEIRDMDRDTYYL
tara:strand:+ start:3066 stop:3410 length:345 start_codon:yes stop_codon:yes gene_type:complete